MRHLAGCLLLIAGPALAQNPGVTPHIGYVYPAGGRQGAEFEVVAGGQFLNGVSGVRISGEGVEASVIEHKRPLTPAQINDLREKLKALMEKRAAGQAPLTPAEEKSIVEIREKLMNLVRRPVNPAIAETVRIQVRVAAGAKPGERELRLATPAGLTNPLKFRIGALPEQSEPHAAKAATVQEVKLPVVVNGQILPGSVDRYRFELAKGQRFMASVEARELIPYISDAVPGWFQAALTLFSPAGKEIASSSNNLFHPDPVLAYEAAETGLYELEIRDSIFRGREDFVYRLSLGPPPAPKPALKPKDKAEREPNNDVKKAQPLKPPFEVSGVIGSPGDVDFFRFNARAGEEIVAEVFARRKGSPMDSVLKIMDALGKQLAFNDDNEDKGSGLLTHHADSRIQLKLPKSGTYFVQIADTQKQSGPAVTYQLRVGRPAPDFELRVVPASVNVIGGMNAAITVCALRRDGFNGEIRLALQDAPDGFSISGARIPAGADKVRLTLTAPPSASGKSYPIHLEGRASAGGRELRRTAVPAEDMMQAFAYHHLVPAQEWIATVIGPNRPRPPWRVDSGEMLRLRAGGQTSLRVAAPLGRVQGEVRLALSDPPEGLAIDSISRAGNSLSVVLKAGDKLAAGVQGNLIFDAYLERAGGNKQVRRVPLGTLPAVPFEVVR